MFPACLPRKGGEVAPRNESRSRAGASFLLLLAKLKPGMHVWSADGPNGLEIIKLLLLHFPAHTDATR